METPAVSSYTIPQGWIRYDPTAVFEPLVQAKSSESELLRLLESMPAAASARNPAMARLSRLVGRDRGRGVPG